MKKQSEFDVIFTGITSYTGKLVANEIARRYSSSNGTFRFAYAGSDLKRMIALEERVHKINPKKESSIVKIELDQTNPDAVRDLCKRTRVICALKGPFDLYGEAIVKACAESGVHYCDITGELDWVSDMRDKYDDIAKATKAAIVPCCGTGFVPVDVLFFNLKKSVKGNEIPRNAELTIFVNEPIPNSWSGGTMRSIFNQKTLIQDPYEPLCKMVENSKGTFIAPFGIFPSYDSLNGKWTAPNLMGEGMAKYCRWANELSGYPMDKTMKVTAKSALTSFISALMQVFSILFMLLLAMCNKVCPQIGSLLTSKPGTGPRRSKQLMETVKINATMQIRDKQHSSIFEYNMGGTYLQTAVSVVEIAVGLAKMERPHATGFSTPTLVMKDAIVHRLERQGFRID